MELNTQYYNSYISNTSGSKPASTLEAFQMAKSIYEEEHKLTPDKVKKEDDWREMSEEAWGKLLAHFDEYMDAYREELEKRIELQEEARMKMAAQAPANMRALVVAQASLKVAANGIIGTFVETDTSELEKQSWTYELASEDQTVLAAAKRANEMGEDSWRQFQVLEKDGTTFTTKAVDMRQKTEEQ